MNWIVLIVGLLIVFIIGWVVLNVRKMKNLPNVPDSKKIKVLSTKNFKHQIKTGKVLVDFWAPWCMPCKMMSPVLNDLAEENGHEVTVAKLNVDEQQQIARQFNIRSIPTMILFKNGKEVRRITGVKSKQHLLKELQAV
jgi:thioredoxin 1